MKKGFLLVAVLTVGMAACSEGGSGGGGGGLSLAECQAIVDKSRSLQGMPDGVFEDEMAQVVQQCDASTTLSRADYDCAMAASDMNAYAACSIDVTR